ncbi:hypothetical protein LZ30DRAFT_725192 [Colletotrichum cereale]|nr:hypothetical protein LZ30DRAFT_725192 [Colletotrichum cereale]
MHFTAIFFVLLPALAAAQTPGNLTASDKTCPQSFRLSCPKGSDNVQRCLLVNTVAVCAFGCPATSTCSQDCIKQGKANGVCTNGSNSCICTNADSGTGFGIGF